MSKFDDLAIKLEEKEKREKEKSIDFDKRKAQWILELESLFSQIKNWVKPLIARKLAKIEKGEMEIQEDLLGRYKVPTLNLHLSNQSLFMRPVGTFIVGAKGRVDIESQGKKVTMVLHEEGWKIPKKEKTGFNYVDCNEDSFAGLIEDLLQ